MVQTSDVQTPLLIILIYRRGDFVYKAWVCMYISVSYNVLSIITQHSYSYDSDFINSPYTTLGMAGIPDLTTETSGGTNVFFNILPCEF